MTVLALASVKLSPGATTTAAALAAAWPTGRKVLAAEIDPAGGDLGTRLDLPSEPGLATLATASRHGLDPELVLSHAHEVRPGVFVLPAPASPTLARGALEVVRSGLAEIIRSGVTYDVIVDCGRADGDSPALPVAAAAQRLVLVTRPRVEEVRHLQARVESLRRVGPPLGLVVVGDRPYRPDEVAHVAGLELLGSLPVEDRGVAALHGSASPLARRSPLLRAARSLADRLAAAQLPARSIADAPVEEARR